MESLVFEGTWEELAAHADQFKGKRLRVMVLPPEGKGETDGSRRRETVARLGGEIFNATLIFTPSLRILAV